MKTLLFCRHGESTANKAGTLAGSLDVALTEKGIQNAEALKDLLRAAPLDHVVTSNLRRAVNTARPIAETHGLALDQWEELREVNFGEAEGNPKVMEGDDSLLEKLVSGRLRGAETLVELEDRALRCWQRLCELSGERICVVGHGVFTTIMFAVHEKVPLEDLPTYRKDFGFENCEVKEISL
jgi:broad specificity phosphatase PhoE